MCAAPSPCRRYRFPPEIIGHAVYLYVRFALSYREVEELLAARGIGVSHETVRRWCLEFGPLYAAEVRRRRPRPNGHWHPDEVYLRSANTIRHMRRRSCGAVCRRASRSGVGTG